MYTFCSIIGRGYGLGTRQASTKTFFLFSSVSFATILHNSNEGHYYGHADTVSCNVLHSVLNISLTCFPVFPTHTSYA